MATNAVITATVVDGVTISSTIKTGATITGTIVPGGVGQTGPQGTPGANGGGAIDVSAAPYNAVGDDTTDDTLAIQAALDAANALGGGAVYVPQGIYKITDALTVYTHVTLLGAGDGPDDGSGAGGGTSATKIHQTGANKNGITGIDVNSFNLENITISGPGSGTGIAVSLTRSSHGDVRYLNFKNVTLQNFAKGLHADGLIMSHFDRVVTYNISGNGFDLVATDTSAATSCTFTSCWAHNGSSVGWNIDHMVYSAFVACGSDVNVGIGYYINNCQGLTFVSCGAESNTGNGFKIDGASYNITLTACWNFHNSSKALYVTGSSIDIAIIGFHENTPTGSPTASIQVDSGSNATIDGYFVVTALSLATGTTTILNDGAGNLTTAANITANGNVRGSNFELDNANASYAVNAHYNSGWKYITTAAAFLMNADGSGGMYFYSAPSGTAGAAITFTEVMHLTTNQAQFGASNGGGSVLTKDITVQPNPGRSTSASIFLDNGTNAFEFFNNASSQFGIFGSGEPFAIDWNANTFHQFQLSSGENEMRVPLNMNSHKITSVTDPGSAQDAATKNYVDTLASATNFVDLTSTQTVGGTKTFSNIVTGNSQFRATDFELTNTNGSFAVNAHFNSGWKYIGTGPAFLMNADGSGGMFFYTAASGSAGGAITFTQKFYISTTTNQMSQDVTMDDGKNIILNTTTGTKIGTATGQKIGVFNATPVAQQAATVDLGTAMSNFGIRAAGTAYPITTSGAVAFSGNFASTGSVRSNTQSQTGAVTLTVNNQEYQLADATSAAFTVTLPSTTSAGQRFTIKKIDSSANAVTIKAGTAGTIDASNTFSLASQYKAVTVVSTSTSDKWYITGSF